MTVTPSLGAARGTEGILERHPRLGQPLGRGRPGDRERLQRAARAEALLPGAAAPAPLRGRAGRLAALGRRDLVLGRVVEGHLDAAGILTAAGRSPAPEALYGVWASASGGTGLTLEPRPGGWHARGRMRYCTGATWIDRALVTARTPEGRLLLLDVDVRGPGWRPVPDTWPAVGMDLSESLDVEVDTAVPGDAQIGPEGHYLARPGFPVGGLGVAAVWLGGTAGVLDAVVEGLRGVEPDPHQLAHLGAMTTAVRSADALLDRTVEAVPRAAPDDLPALALAARSGVESAARLVLDLAPRATGPTPLCRDGDRAHRIGDLLVYVRQHHAERDLAALGRYELEGGSFGSAPPSGPEVAAPGPGS